MITTFDELQYAFSPERSSFESPLYIAEHAISIEPEHELRRAALDYLTARSKFIELLDKYNIDHGDKAGRR